MAAVRAASAVINQFEGQAVPPDICTVQRDTLSTEQKLIVSIERVQPQNATNGENIDTLAIERDQIQAKISPDNVADHLDEPNNESSKITGSSIDMSRVEDNVEATDEAMSQPLTVTEVDSNQVNDNQSVGAGENEAEVEAEPMIEESVVEGIREDDYQMETDRVESDQKELALNQPVAEQLTQEVMSPDTVAEQAMLSEEAVDVSQEAIDVDVARDLPATDEEVDIHVTQDLQASADEELDIHVARDLPTTDEEVDVHVTQDLPATDEEVDVRVTQDLPTTDEEQSQSDQVAVQLEDGELEESLPLEPVVSEQSDNSVSKITKVGVSSDTAVDTAPIELDVVVSTVEDDFSAFSAEAAEVESNQQNLLSNLSSKTCAESEKGGDRKRSEAGEESKDESEV